ncbi:MAG: hypothetical protein HY927_13250 [Elusimicrobia bacterium]|nr:hypothetical protein [Elusimicrobiota bacterium]
MNRTALYGIVGLIALAGGLLFLWGFGDLVVQMGHFIPQEDLATDYLYGVTWAMFLGLSILAWPVPGRDKPLLMRAWVAKSLVTLGFMLIYENHYPTDGFGYFASAASEFFDLGPFQIGDGTDNMYRLAHLHSQIFPISFHMMKVSFSLAGFLGLYSIYRAGTLFVQKEDARVFYVLMLFPSHIFWSSILGKDPIILLGIGLYTYGVAGWYRTNRYRYLFVLALGIFETAFIRVWMSSILIAPLSVFFLARMRSSIAKAVFIACVLAAFGWSHERFKSKFNIETSTDLVQVAGYESQAWAYGGSAQHLDASISNIGNMVTFLPLGMATALFRPLPGEVLNVFGMLASLENVIFIGVVLFAAMRTRWRDLLEPMVLWAAILVLAWSTTYSFVSYQNLGTAARFKMQIMPIFLGLIMYLSRRRVAPAASQPSYLGRRS